MSESEGELALARLALDDGDLAHAADHIAGAIGADPAAPEAYDVLAELYRRAPADTLAQFTESRYVGGVAALAFVRFLDGDADQAVVLIGDVVRHQPELAWTDARWFGDPAFLSSVGAASLVQGVLRAIGTIPDLVGVGLVDRFRPWIRAIDAVAARPDADPANLANLAILPRRCGMIFESLALCDRADAIEPVLNTAVVRGGTFRHVGKLAEAVAEWRRGLELDASNVSVYLDIADVSAELGDFDTAIHSVDQALAIDSGNVKLRAARAAFGAHETGSTDELMTLVDLVREHPGIGYLSSLLTLACDGRVWQSVVPQPTEAVVGLLAKFAARKGRELPSDEPVMVTLSGIESPSAIGALRWAFPAASVIVAEVPAPDGRILQIQPRYRLWAYDGTDARPVVAPPSARAIEALRRVAEYGWSHPLDAYDTAIAFAGLSVDDLLGLLAHTPGPPLDNPEWRRVSASNPAYWPRFAQSWAALGILHVRSDEPWASSTRRAILVDLLRGMEDWAVLGAAFALAVAAWIDPADRADVAALVAERLRHYDRVAAQRTCEITVPLAHIVRMTPDVSGAANTLARRVIAADER